MLKNADGTAMKKDDFRIIHKSAPIINGPYAYNSDLPDDLKAAIAKAFIEVADQGQGGVRPPVRRPEEGLSIRPPPKTGMSTIELIKFVDNLRKKKAS